MSVSKGRIVGHWLGAHVVLIAAAVAVVAVYAYGIDPGQQHAHYEAFAKRASPWVSIAFGLPVFFFIGYRLGKRAGLKVWALYTVTDLAIVGSAVAGGELLTGFFAGQWVTSQAIKLVGVLWGG